MGDRSAPALGLGPAGTSTRAPETLRTYPADIAGSNKSRLSRQSSTEYCTPQHSVLRNRISMSSKVASVFSTLADRYGVQACDLLGLEANNIITCDEFYYNLSSEQACSPHTIVS